MSSERGDESAEVRRLHSEAEAKDRDIRQLGERVLLVGEPRLRRIGEDLGHRDLAQLRLRRARLDERHDARREIGRRCRDAERNGRLHAQLAVLDRRGAVARDLHPVGHVVHQPVRHGVGHDASARAQDAVDRAQRRYVVGNVLDDVIEKDDIERGQVLSKPGSITPHTEFDAEVYILNKDEGGRHTPFFKGYKPQFYFRTTDVTGEVELPADKEMVMPGDTITFKVKLLAPIAMDQGLNFAIREGGRTVGAGVVTKINK